MMFGKGNVGKDYPGRISIVLERNKTTNSILSHPGLRRHMGRDELMLGA
jgi:hypothetical protein